jgi:GNAT superfamily N-acetyltransferase
MAIEEHLVAPSVVGQETFRGHSRLLAHAAVSHDPCVAWVVAGKNGCVSGDFVVVPAEAKRFDDVAAVLGCSEGTPCCCQYWRMTSVEYSRSSLDVRRKALRSQLAESPPGGMLAYLDGEPVGWCGFGPRARVGRLVRSRTIPQIDDLPVWSVYCFTVRVGFRRRGVARSLLEGLITFASPCHAPALEAYPVDTGGSRIHGTAAYVGTVGMFERIGFRRVLETAARSDHRPRVLMRLEL